MLIEKCFNAMLRWVEISEEKREVHEKGMNFTKNRLFKMWI